jgi:hypothetical protein
MFEDLNSIKALSWDLFGLFAFVRGLYLFLTKRCNFILSPSHPGD